MKKEWKNHKYNYDRCSIVWFIDSRQGDWDLRYFVAKRELWIKKKSKKIINSKDIVFEKYHDFLNVFFKKKADILFSHRKYDHRIELLKKKVFIRAFFYRMSEDELQIIKNYLKEHLNKNFIMINSAFFASSILFVKKSNDELRFCVNF